MTHDGAGAESLNKFTVGGENAARLAPTHIELVRQTRNELVHACREYLMTDALSAAKRLKLASSEAAELDQGLDEFARKTLGMIDVIIQTATQSSSRIREAIDKFTWIKSRAQCSVEIADLP